MHGTYADQIDALIADLTGTSYELPSSRTRGRRPGTAFSDFITHREQGDWAEDVLFRALEAREDTQLTPLRYGRTDDIVAGEPGFAEFFDAYQDELDDIGKRPDLLLVAGDEIPSAVTSLQGAGARDHVDLVSSAVAAFEIRSSAHLVSRYRSYRSENPSSSGRSELSFTPKVEDLRLIGDWIRVFGVPHYYVQVFFDEVHGISFQTILELLVADASGVRLEINRRNQGKSTIHVDLSHGIQLAAITEGPQLSASLRDLPNGRRVVYVQFGGGRAEVDSKALHRLISLDG